MATNPTFTRYKAAAQAALRPNERLRFLKGQGYIRVPQVAKAAAAAAAPTGQGTQPFQNAIKNEGIFAADSANIAASNAAAQAQADAARKALLFQYNDPSNPYSTTTQLERQRSEQSANDLAERAARGVLYSGGTRASQGDIAYQAGLARTNALNAVTGQIGSIDANLAQTQRENFGSLQSAINEATQRLIDNGMNPTVAAQTAAKAVAQKQAQQAPVGTPYAPGTAPRPTGLMANQPWVEGRDYKTVTRPDGSSYQQAFYQQVNPGSRETFFVPFSYLLNHGNKLPGQGTAEWYSLKRKYGTVKSVAQARALWGGR